MPVYLRDTSFFFLTAMSAMSRLRWACGPELRHSYACRKVCKLAWEQRQKGHWSFEYIRNTSRPLNLVEARSEPAPGRAPKP